ncbi:MAG TPA: biotin/lipoyl-binding protein, partial [Polyangia bacterium]
MVAIASLAGLVFAAWRLHAPVVRVVSVRRSDLQQHIVVSGRVRVPTRAQLSARSPGLVVAVLANEGRRVSAGDLLVQLDDAEAQAASAQARAAMNQSRARVD